MSPWFLGGLLSLSGLTALPLASAAESVFDHPAEAKNVAGLVGAAAGRFIAAQVIRGEFVQKRYLSELPRPMRSSGDFVVARGIGIEWHTRAPFDSAVVLSTAGIATRSDGVDGTVNSTQLQPALGIVVRVFSALFALDMQALSKDFKIFAERRDARWKIGLKPRHRILAGVFRNVVVEGSTHIERVTLTDVRGDRTEIAMQALRYESTAPSPVERSRF